MQVVDLFSGIGGFSLSAHGAGWRTVHFCEINTACHKVLRHHFPGIPIHNDIKTFGIEILKANPLYSESEQTIVVGGFPCQPYSLAGKRKGKDDERHLWPEMLRVIREARPEWVVGENVYGLVNWNQGLVFDEVCADLENEGFQVWPVILPAAGVGAPHKRDRIWFIAHSVSNRNWRAERRSDAAQKGLQGVDREIDGAAREFSGADQVDVNGGNFGQYDRPHQDANGNGWRSEFGQGQSGEWELRNLSAGDHERIQANNGETGNASDISEFGRQRIGATWRRGTGFEDDSAGTPPDADNPGSRTHGEPEAEVGEREHTLPEPGGPCDTGVITDAHEFGWQRSGVLGSGVSESSNGYSEPVGDVTHTASQGLPAGECLGGNNESRLTAAERSSDRGVPERGDATNAGSRGRIQDNQGFRAEKSQHAGVSSWRKDQDWSDFPTVSPVCSRNDELSLGLVDITFPRWRRQSIQQLGNSIVPKVAYQIFETINAFNKQVYGE